MYDKSFYQTIINRAKNNYSLKQAMLMIKKNMEFSFACLGFI